MLMTLIWRVRGPMLAYRMNLSVGRLMLGTVCFMCDCRPGTQPLSLACPAGACEGSLACSTCHVVIEVQCSNILTFDI